MSAAWISMQCTKNDFRKKQHQKKRTLLVAGQYQELDGKKPVWIHHKDTGQRVLGIHHSWPIDMVMALYNHNGWFFLKYLFKVHFHSCGYLHKYYGFFFKHRSHKDITLYKLLYQCQNVSIPESQYAININLWRFSRFENGLFGLLYLIPACFASFSYFVFRENTNTEVLERQGVKRGLSKKWTK